MPRSRSFSFSSSAAESGVATFYKDENRDAQYNELAESKLDENENVVYFVNGEAADEDAFTAVINAQNEKADVTFVPATAENLALYQFSIRNRFFVKGSENPPET